MRKEQGLNVVMVIIGLILAGLMIWAAVVLANMNNGNNNQQATVQGGNDDGLIKKINDKPGEYYGKETTVTAKVSGTYSSRTFQIAGEGVSNEMLVIIRSPLTDDQADAVDDLIAEGATVKVKGTLRQLVASEIQSDTGVVLSAETENEFRSRPVLIAESVTFLDKDNKEWKFAPPVQYEDELTE